MQIGTLHRVGVEIGSQVMLPGSVMGIWGGFGEGSDGLSPSF